MTRTTTGRLAAALLALGAICSMPQALALSLVWPGTYALFEPSDIDGGFAHESADCGPTNLCRTASDAPAGEAYTYTASLVNQTQSTRAVSGLYKQFEVPSVDGTETVLNANVSGCVSWRGSFLNSCCLRGTFSPR